MSPNICVHDGEKNTCIPRYVIVSKRFTIILTLQSFVLIYFVGCEILPLMSQTTSTGDMPPAAVPLCPICAMGMHLTGTFPVTFSGGRSDYILKYACNTCHVEMNRTVKNPSVINHNSPATMAAPPITPPESHDKRVGWTMFEVAQVVCKAGK